MRFKRKTYKNGEERIKTFFAWFPVNADGETRWLETVTLKQECVHDTLEGGCFFENLEFLESHKKHKKKK